MPTLLMGGITAFDDLTTQTSVYIIYALAFIIVLLWAIASFYYSRGLVNHRNAVTLRAFVNFLRTTENQQGNQLNNLFELLTKTQNDIAMLFHMYCRIHINFLSIEHYLNYRTYKQINTKQKPWGFTAVIITTLLITMAFSISYFVGFNYLFNKEASVSNIFVALAFPVGLLLLWLLLRVFILMKYKMYWVEFENMFRKVNLLCGEFFFSQEEYYEEFSDNILSKVIPTGGVKRRIERIIASTDPDDVESRKLYKSRPRRKKDKEDIEEKKAAAPVPTVTNAAVSDPNQKNFPQMPMGAGIRVLKPHPETEAYLQAQSQITQQLMSMMMQQSMQQSQVIQRALSSQQALANTVAQQNIMAMRLEAQQASLLRPDIAKRLSEHTYVWPTNKAAMEREMEEERTPTAPAAKKSSQDSTVIVEITPDEVEMPSNKKTTAKNADTNDMPAEKPKDEKELAKETMLQKLQQAFELLSPPPDEKDKQPDPVFLEPGRDLTHVEKKLAEFFAAKVYLYDDN